MVDLYELKLAERRRFVRLFLESLIHLPRDLWRPTPVILDEAHIYYPERGSGEAESTEAVISLMSQGRKRGYAGVIATQRLSKLHKDAAAEANNVIIGRTSLDADQVRAGDALGLSKADRLKLRDVGQGEFYAFGPALGQPGVVHFRSDRVRTTHEIEEEIRGLNEARRRIAELERQIKYHKGASAAQQTDHLAIQRAIKSAVEQERAGWQRKLERGSARLCEIGAVLASTGQSLEKVKELLEETEREWLTRPAVVTAPRSSVNLRPERTAKATNGRVAPAETLDGPLIIDSPLENAEF